MIFKGKNLYLTFFGKVKIWILSLLVVLFFKSHNDAWPRTEVIVTDKDMCERHSNCAYSTHCGAFRERSRWTRWESELVSVMLFSTSSMLWQLLVVSRSLTSSALCWKK